MTDSRKLHARYALGRRNLVRAASVIVGALAALTFSGKPAAARRGGGHGGRCFLRGTQILTASGYRRVETLAVGDLLPTRFSGVSPIKCVSHYHYRKSDPSEPWARSIRPVRIARSALADGVPSADLCVTPSHAVFIDGVLVRADNLVNDMTITIDDAHDRGEIEYFHIELARHDVIDAEGALCETLQGEREIRVLSDGHVSKIWLPRASCAPILSFDGGRSELKSRLRSAASPFVDRRQKLDVIRDRLEDRALAMRHPRASQRSLLAA